MVPRDMTPFDVLDEVKRRTAEAVIAQSGLSHEGLRHHLRELLGGDDPTGGALLQEPVLEGAHPFVTADETMAELSGSLLHPDLVSVLDELPADHEYRFPRSRKPFRHQADVWRILADQESQSVLVTSGTGSGKTECFVFPILSDLAAQAHSARPSALVLGVAVLAKFNRVAMAVLGLAPQVQTSRPPAKTGCGAGCRGDASAFTPQRSNIELRQGARVICKSKEG